jgi:hypothetical protein
MKTTLSPAVFDKYKETTEYQNLIGERNKAKNSLDAAQEKLVNLPAYVESRQAEYKVKFPTAEFGVGRQSYASIMAEQKVAQSKQALSDLGLLPGQKIDLLDRFVTKESATIATTEQKTGLLTTKSDEFLPLRTTMQPVSDKPFSGVWIDSVALKKETVKLQRGAETVLDPLKIKLETLSPLLDTKNSESVASKFKTKYDDYQKDATKYNLLMKAANDQAGIFEKTKSQYLSLKAKYEADPKSVSYSEVDKAYKNQLRDFDVYKTLQTQAEAQGQAVNLFDRQKEIQTESQNLQQTAEDFNKTLEKYNEGLRIYKQSLENVRYADRFNIIDDEYARQMKAAGALGKVGVFGKEVAVGLAKGLRNVIEIPVAGVRETAEDISQKKYGEAFKDVTVPLYAMAKGVYDWDDPTNKDFKWYENVNWRAVEGGVNVALMGGGFAYSASKATLAEPVKAVAKATFGQTLKAGAKTVGKVALVESFAVVPAGISAGATYYKTGDLSEAGNIFLTQAGQGTGQILFAGGTTKIASGLGGYYGKVQLEKATQKAIENIMFSSKAKGYQVSVEGEKVVPKIVSPLTKEFGQTTQQFQKVVQNIPGTKFSIEVLPGKARTFVQTQKDLPVTLTQTTQRFRFRYLDTATNKPITSWKRGEAKIPRLTETKLYPSEISTQQKIEAGDTTLIKTTDLYPSRQTTIGTQTVAVQTPKGIKYITAPLKETKVAKSLVETQRVANEPELVTIMQKGKFLERQYVGKPITMTRAEYDVLAKGSDFLRKYNIISPKSIERLSETQQTIKSGAITTGKYFTTGAEKGTYITGRAVTTKIPVEKLPPTSTVTSVKRTIGSVGQDIGDMAKRFVPTKMLLGSKKSTVAITPSGGRIMDFTGRDFGFTPTGGAKITIGGGRSATSALPTGSVISKPYLETPGVIDTSGALKMGLTGAISVYGGTPMLPGAFSLMGVTPLVDSLYKERISTYSGTFGLLPQTELVSGIEPASLLRASPTTVTASGTTQMVEPIIKIVTIPDETVGTTTTESTTTDTIVGPPPPPPPPYVDPFVGAGYYGPATIAGGFGMPFMGSLGQFGKRGKRKKYVREWSVKNPFARPEEAFFAKVSTKTPNLLGFTPSAQSSSKKYWL